MTVLQYIYIYIIRNDIDLYIMCDVIDLYITHDVIDGIDIFTVLVVAVIKMDMHSL